MPSIGKNLMTAVSEYKQCQCPLCDLGMTFESMLNLDKGI